MKVLNKEEVFDSSVHMALNYVNSNLKKPCINRLNHLLNANESAEALIDAIKCDNSDLTTLIEDTWYQLESAFDYNPDEIVYDSLKHNIGLDKCALGDFSSSQRQQVGQDTLKLVNYANSFKSYITDYYGDLSEGVVA